jgi:TRAP-type mannitol/chloroaromatic compound transport system permease small subunit
MKRMSDFIDRLNTWIGRTAAFLILPLVFVIMYEVVSRYLFNAPTRWSNEISQYLLVAVVMLGGGYCLVDNEHVNVDIFYRKFTWRTRAVVEILTFILVVSFVAAIVWKGGELSYDALIHDKRSQTILAMPLFPSMVLVPIGAVLIGLQSLARALRAVIHLACGTEPGKES